MIASRDFSSLKGKNLQLSSRVSKVGNYPREYGEGPSSVEAFHPTHSPVAASDLPHPRDPGEVLIGQMRWKSLGGSRPPDPRAADMSSSSQF